MCIYTYTSLSSYLHVHRERERKRERRQREVHDKVFAHVVTRTEKPTIRYLQTGNLGEQVV